jgi:hypothetical protein
MTAMISEEAGINQQQENMQRRLERELAQVQAHNMELRESILVLQEQVRECTLSSVSLTSELDASNAKIADLEAFLTNIERDTAFNKDELAR